MRSALLAGPGGLTLMARTSVNRHDVLSATTTLRSTSLETGEEWGGSTYNFDTSEIFSDVTEVRNTVNSPQWVRKNRWSGADKVKLRPNPFSYTYVRYSPFWGTKREIVPSQGFQALWAGRIPGWNGAHSEFSDEEKAAVVQAAKIKLGKAFKDQKVNLAQAYGERKQAIRLFNDAAVRVVGGLRALKRGDLRSAADAFGVAQTKLVTQRGRKARTVQQLDLSGFIAQNRLAYVYGVEPLMSDVYGAAEKVAQAHVDGVLDTVRHAVSSTRRLVVSTPLVVDGVLGKQYTTAQYTAKFVVRAAIPRPELTSVASLGFTNPATLLWELTPWSFVIDWFIRIGDYLNYLDSFSAYTFLDGSFTVFERNQSGAIVTGEAETSFGPVIIHARGTYYAVYCQRTVLDSWPTLSLPRPKNPFSVGHAMNALALFRTTFFKRK